MEWSNAPLATSLCVAAAPSHGELSTRSGFFAKTCLATRSIVREFDIV